MGRSPCCDENGLKKGPWTPEEDQKLVQYIQKHGHGSWRALPKLSGLNRCGKSCRLRWTNYLRPDIKRGKFSFDEEQTILNLHSILGNKWSAISQHLPGRTDNEIKNFWNTHLKKKLIQNGLDPMTHRPRTDIFASLPHLIALANLKELMDHQPWDDHSVRLQAEAVQVAKLQYLQYLVQSATMANHSNNSSMITTDLQEAASYLNTTISTLPSINPPDYSGISSQVSISHLSELQIPCIFQQPLSNETNQDSSFTCFREGEENSTTPMISWVSPNSTTLPSLMDVSIGNTGDVSSTSTTTTPFWPELLIDETFITEFS